MSTAFYHIVAISLYLVKRARPDANVMIAFLTTQVRLPDIDDWRKLKHLIEYLHSTAEIPFILGADSSGVLNTMHTNMYGHTGGG